MNFLTASTYAQIEALQRQGDAQGAANLAEETYANALTTRANNINSNLGYVEGAWKLVKNAAKDAWDAMLDIGRESSIEQKLKQLNGSFKRSPTRTRSTTPPAAASAPRRRMTCVGKR